MPCTHEAPKAIELKMPAAFFGFTVHVRPLTPSRASNKITLTPFAFNLLAAARPGAPAPMITDHFRRLSFTVLAEAESIPALIL